jgi:hypothetical protein
MTLTPFVLDPTGWLEATWMEGAAQVRCVSYHPTQIDMLRADAAAMGTPLDEHQAMLDEWVAGYVPAPADPAALRAALSAQLAGEYERRMQIIAAGYPPSERESWPVQTGEAHALLADPVAATPWIDAAAAARGLDRVELAQRIVAKDDAYRVIHGTLTGARQALEDVIGAAGDDVQALQAIDVTTGWPGIF